MQAYNSDDDVAQPAPPPVITLDQVRGVVGEVFNDPGVDPLVLLSDDNSLFHLVEQRIWGREGTGQLDKIENVHLKDAILVYKEHMASLQMNKNWGPATPAPAPATVHGDDGGGEEKKEEKEDGENVPAKALYSIFAAAAQAKSAGATPAKSTATAVKAVTPDDGAEQPPTPIAERVANYIPQINMLSPPSRARGLIAFIEAQDASLTYNNADPYLVSPMDWSGCFHAGGNGRGAPQVGQALMDEIFELNTKILRAIGRKDTESVERFTNQQLRASLQLQIERPGGTWVKSGSTRTRGSIYVPPKLTKEEHFIPLNLLHAHTAFVAVGQYGSNTEVIRALREQGATIHPSVTFKDICPDFLKENRVTLKKGRRAIVSTEGDFVIVDVLYGDPRRAGLISLRTGYSENKREPKVTIGTKAPIKPAAVATGAIPAKKAAPKKKAQTAKFSLHIAVIRTFLGPSTVSGMTITVDHINREANDDQRLINLRWASSKQQGENRDYM
ncbi:hypothetical protein ACHAXT_002969 [Thalassiosira profunda]